MKLEDLSDWNKDTLRFEGRDIDGVYADLDNLEDKNYLALRLQGYIIDSDGEILTPRSDAHGTYLKKCYNGLPCRFACGGEIDGKCTMIPMPSCNVSMGLCKHINGCCPRWCKEENDE